MREPCPYCGLDTATGPNEHITSAMCIAALKQDRAHVLKERNALNADIAQSNRERDKARVISLNWERRALRAEAKLKFCAGLAEHWRMQASVTSRRSAWSANGALEKCTVELEKALALDQTGKGE